MFTVNKRPSENIATDGIDMEPWETDGLHINCYDFGGQEVYYPTHQFFATARSFYIIVFDLSDSKMSKLEYWAEFVHSISIPEPQVKNLEKFRKNSGKILKSFSYFFLFFSIFLKFFCIFFLENF